MSTNLRLCAVDGALFTCITITRIPPGDNQLIVLTPLSVLLQTKFIEKKTKVTKVQTSSIEEKNEMK